MSIVVISYIGRALGVATCFRKANFLDSANRRGYTATEVWVLCGLLKELTKGLSKSDRQPMAS